MMTSIDSLGTLVANTTMRAAVEILKDRGLTKKVDTSALIVAIRREALGAAQRILQDGKALLDGGSSGWLGELVKVECCAAGLTAVNTVTGSKS